MFHVKHQGGITFWRIGCFGGSFYRSCKPARIKLPTQLYGRINWRGL